MTFDPACDFLLSLRYESLFDRIGGFGGAPEQYECRGCRVRIARREREKHHARHARDVPKERAKAAAKARQESLRLARKAKQVK